MRKFYFVLIVGETSCFQRTIQLVVKIQLSLQGSVELLADTLGRIVYIVIFPHKCILGTFACECRPIFLTWFWNIIKRPSATVYGLAIWTPSEVKTKLAGEIIR